MARYYDEYARGGSRRPRRSLWLFLLDLALGIVTVAVIAVQVLTFLAPYVNPGRWWVFSVLGLAAPAVYIVTVVLTLYWIIRWRWAYASVLLVLAVIGLFKVSLFYKPEFKRGYGDPEYGRGTFTVMTFNVRYFYDEDGRSSAGKVLRLIGEREPDVICFQEFNPRLVDEESEAEILRDGYHCTSGTHRTGSDALSDTQLLICSKFPVLRSGTLLPHTSIWADLLVGDDTVRVFCNHLRSTAITSSDDAYLSERRFLSDTAREVKIRSMLERFRDNSVLRAAQVDSIAREIAATGGRKIVCGDFNDTPMSYVYRTMADGLQDVFRACGRGYSHTFRGFGNTLRIDYALVSPGLEPLGYEVLDVNCSDHRPVEVRLRKDDNQT